MKLLVPAALLFVALAARPPVCHAHPETGLLPDAIAEMEYQVVLEITPGDIKTRNKLGIVLVRKKKLNEAAKAFTEVLRTAPNDFDATNGMGLVRLKERKADEALAWLKKAALLNKEDTLVHADLAAAYELAGDLAKAEASYKKGLEVNASLLQRGLNKDAETARRTTLLTALKNLQDKMKSAKVAK